MGQKSFVLNLVNLEWVEKEKKMMIVLWLKVKKKGDFVEIKNDYFYFLFFRLESEVLRGKSGLLEKGPVARK